jgi:integrase
LRRRPASINRICTVLKAALNLATSRDTRLSARAWEVGLATIPDAEEARNVILGDSQVLGLIEEARAYGTEFGLLVEVAAITGARVSQIHRLEVQDLQLGKAPRLMMPASRKGKGAKKVMRRPVPISLELAARLAAPVEGQAPTAPLLVKPGGEPWKKSDHSRPFARVARLAGLDPHEVTLYALRHSSIVRQLLCWCPDPSRRGQPRYISRDDRADLQPVYQRSRRLCSPRGPLGHDAGHGRRRGLAAGSAS